MRSFSAIVICLLTGVAGSADPPAMSIASATWVPGTGQPQQLIDGGNAVQIDTAVSLGKVIIQAQSTSSPNSVTLAYAINYDGVHWHQRGAERYFSLGAEFITITPSPSGSTITATIPFLNDAFFHPFLNSDQTLYVWMGRSGPTQVDPVNGVTGFDAQATYRAHTQLPAVSIVPPDASHVFGINAPGEMSMQLFRRDVSQQPEFFNIQLSGNQDLIQALACPNFAVIQPNQNHANIQLTFDPRIPRQLPSTAASVTVTMTSANYTVTTNLLFSGFLHSDFLIQPPPGEHEYLETYCNPTTIASPQPMESGDEPCVEVGEDTDTGECKKAGDTHVIWYYRYSCVDGVDTCTSFTNTFVAKGTLFRKSVQVCELSRSLNWDGSWDIEYGIQCHWFYVRHHKKETWEIEDCK